MLAREVLRMRGTISREHPWEVMPDLYFYRDPEEVGILMAGSVSLWDVLLVLISHGPVCLLSRTGFANVMMALHTLPWWIIVSQLVPVA